MLVDVVCLRSKGERLAFSTVKATVPLRGHLGVFIRREMHRNTNVPVAMLEGNVLGEFAIPVLDYMRLTRIRGDSFLLVGFEEIVHRKERDEYPQAWWCRVVCERTGTTKAVTDEEVDEVVSVF